MKYGVLFLIIGVLFAYYAFLVGGWGWLLLWPALSFSSIALAYLGLGARVFGNRADGTIAPLALLALFPYFLYAWAIWHLSRIVRREDCYNEVAPGLYIGRRPLPGELPADTRVVVDLTAEFPEKREVREAGQYLCLPTLDASVPGDRQFKELLASTMEAPTPAYLHCAEGHGRSGTLGAAILILRGLAENVEDAVRLLRKSRPGIRLSNEQKALVTRVCLMPPARVALKLRRENNQESAAE